MDRGVPEPAEVLHQDITLDLDARRASSIDPVTLDTVEAALDAPPRPCPSKTPPLR